MNSNLFNEAMAGGGLLGILIAAVFGAAILGYWVLLLIRGDILKAFCVFIISMPFGYFATRVFGVTAYYAGDPVLFAQRLGLTTLMLFVLFVRLLQLKRFKRIKSKVYTIYERLLWIYCIAITIDQLFNHTFFSAITLSIGAAWQYLILFYITTSVIQNERDLLRTINSLLIFAVVNKAFMMLTKGVPLIKSLQLNLSDDELREGIVGALGPSVSAAVYLAVLLTLGFALYYYKGKNIYLLFILFAFVEILNTFTRGGVVIILLLAILFCFKEHRSLLKKVAFLSLFTIPFWGIIWRYISFRGFSLDEGGSFGLRFLLINKYFTEYYTFLLGGHGIFKPTQIQIYDWLSFPLHNAYLEILDTCGIIPFVIFVFISFYSVWSLLAIYRSKKNEGALASAKTPFTLIPFFLVAMVQWIIYANTTSTSVLYYYPYEGTIIFWMLCFSPIFFLRVGTLSSITIQGRAK